MKYLEFNGNLFNPDDNWVSIFDKLIFPLYIKSNDSVHIRNLQPQKNTQNMVNQLRLKFYNYPNVVKACNAFDSNTWYYDILDEYGIT